MIQRKKPNESAFEKAMGYIFIRSRSEKEIQDYLFKKCYTSNEIDEAVDKLKEYGYINDVNFCREYVASKRKSWGRLKIIFELKKFGVEGAAVDEVYECVENEHIDAYNIAVKYISQKKDWEVNKLYTFLFQKGFPSSVVSEALTLLKEQISEVGEENLKKWSE